MTKESLAGGERNLKAIEENIIQKFSAGQEKAFRVLYERYAPGLRFFAAQYMKERAAIDDVVQDAFVKLWEKRGDFPNERTVKVFLYTFIKNASLNLFRHHNVKERYAQVVSLENNQEFFLDRILEAELFELLLHVFDELTPACREVYHLSLEGKSHDEIAKTLNITVNTVKKHKNNANRYMRERLKNMLMFLLSV